MSEALDIVSHRGAEEAEAAKVFELKAVPPSAPLRETLSALRVGVAL
jgi:hypothetical protein